MTPPLRFRSQTARPFAATIWACNAFFLLSLVSALGRAEPVHARPLAPPPELPAPPHPLAWDAFKKDYAAKLGDKSASLAFAVENTSDQPVAITEIRPSCGCTTTDTPPLPWKLAPGEHGSMKVSVDLVGKFGEMTKTIHVTSSAGQQDLQVHINVPLPMGPNEQRKQLEQIMLADRQAIFRRDDCVTCHAQPAAFKTGEPLYQAACAICHAAEHRSAMVPDLAVVREPRDAAFWQKLIADGREHTLMPGFSQAMGGPLNEAQIASLVEYALQAFPTKP
jgi:mono/diheme cytochrome c family protein